MASINNVVTVQITKGTRTVSLAGFGIPLIMGASNRFTELVRYYTDPADMITDGFTLSDPEYIHASRVMGQDKKPDQFGIGKYVAPVLQVDTITPTAVNLHVYTVTINGVAYVYTGDADATVSEIVAGLLALINADSAAPCVATGTVTLILTAKVAGVGFTTSINADVDLTLVHTTANHSIVDDIIALQAVSDIWYGLCIASKAYANQLQVADYIETQLKLFVAASADAGVIATSTTDIAYKLKAKNYDRTAVIYSTDSANGPDAAWLGRLLPTGVGETTWKFKTLKGIISDDLGQTAINNAAGKNSNIYIPIGGADMTSEGKVASGEFIDVIRFIDWVTATVKSAVFTVFLNSEKVPYTNNGINQIVNAIEGVMAEGVNNGGFSNDPEPTVTAPDANAVSQNDKATRTLNGVVFNGTLAGAVHKANLRGFISV